MTSLSTVLIVVSSLNYKMFIGNVANAKRSFPYLNKLIRAVQAATAHRKILWKIELFLLESNSFS